MDEKVVEKANEARREGRCHGRSYDVPRYRAAGEKKASRAFMASSE